MIRINAQFRGAQAQQFLERFSQAILENAATLSSLELDISGDLSSPIIQLNFSDLTGIAFDCVRRYIREGQ